MADPNNPPPRTDPLQGLPEVKRQRREHEGDVIGPGPAQPAQPVRQDPGQQQPAQPDPHGGGGNS